jgi:hypothetical protein
MGCRGLPPTPGIRMIRRHFHSRGTFAAVRRVRAEAPPPPQTAVEPEIGHMAIRQKRSGWRIGPIPRSGMRPRRGEGEARVRADGLPGRNFLKGMQGDAINAIHCGAGHSLRKILARMRALLYPLTGPARAALQDLRDHLNAFTPSKRAPDAS